MGNSTVPRWLIGLAKTIQIGMVVFLSLFVIALGIFGFLTHMGFFPFFVGLGGWLIGAPLEWFLFGAIARNVERQRRDQLESPKGLPKKPVRESQTPRRGAIIGAVILGPLALIVWVGIRPVLHRLPQSFVRRPLSAVDTHWFPW